MFYLILYDNNLLFFKLKQDLLRNAQSVHPLPFGFSIRRYALPLIINTSFIIQ